jgi:SMC interacting uncharacterized protein involved in chromosome segregation
MLIPTIAGGVKSSDRGELERRKADLEQELKDYAQRLDYIRQKAACYLDRNTELELEIRNKEKQKQDLQAQLDDLNVPSTP